MSSKFAACGLNCNECPAFIALAKDDQELRVKTAADWSEMYKAQLQPEDINCEGCLSSDGVLFSHCHKCEIRKCCRERQLENCSECSDYPCTRINEFFKYVPEAEKNLNSLRT